MKNSKKTMSYSVYQVAEWFRLLSGLLLPPCDLLPHCARCEVGDSKEVVKIGPSHPILQQSVAALK